MRLNIGCGNTPREPGVLNADMYPASNVDVVFNACGQWPFLDNSIDSIQANHVLEHLPNPTAFFREAWRVVKPGAGANLLMRLPNGASNEHIGDPTHVSQFVAGSFCSLQPGYGAAIGNLQYEDNAPWEVFHVLQRINKDLRWLLKPVIRRWGVKAIPFLWGGYTELVVTMRACKTQDDLTRFKIRQPANAIPLGSFIYEDEYHGRPVPTEGRARMLFFGEQAKELQRLFDGKHN